MQTMRRSYTRYRNQPDSGCMVSYDPFRLPPAAISPDGLSLSTPAASCARFRTLITTDPATISVLIGAPFSSSVTGTLVNPMGTALRAKLTSWAADDDEAFPCRHRPFSSQ